MRSNLDKEVRISPLYLPIVKTKLCPALLIASWASLCFNNEMSCPSTENMISPAWRPAASPSDLKLTWKVKKIGFCKNIGWRKTLLLLKSFETLHFLKIWYMILHNQSHARLYNYRVRHGKLVFMNYLAMTDRNMQAR